jgi:hypothetical protein
VAECIGYRTVRARRRHRCIFCSDPIEPGRLYEQWAVADAGSLWTCRGHQGCCAVSDASGADPEDIGTETEDALSGYASWDQVAALLAKCEPEEVERLRQMWEAARV